MTMRDSNDQIMTVAHQVHSPVFPLFSVTHPLYLSAKDADTSIRSAKDEDDLPPLERARRRRSFLPGGQTRLI